MYFKDETIIGFSSYYSVLCIAINSICSLDY